MPILLLFAFGLSLPLLCLASLTSLGAPGGSNLCLHLQQVTLNEVSEDGSEESELDEGVGYSIFAVQAG